MTRYRTLNAALLLALAAAVPAFAATEEVTSAYVAPAPGYYTPPATTYYYVPSTSDYVAPATTYYYVPSTTTVYYEPPVIVNAPRSTDEAINDDVVETLASDPRISGRIGSDTFNGNVTLNGRVGTPFQAQMAEQDAKSVDGVNDVDNRIRPVVGEH
jgi:hypothetical protein